MYNNVTLAQTMSSKSYKVKSKHDYSIVLQARVNAGAAYTLILEDDVVFLLLSKIILLRRSSWLEPRIMADVFEPIDCHFCDRSVCLGVDTAVIILLSHGLTSHS